jgi:hypothetical protein
MTSEEAFKNPFWIHYTDDEGGHILLDSHGFPIQLSWQDMETGKIDQILTLVSDTVRSYAPLSEKELDWAIKNNESNYISIVAAVN